MSLRGKPTVLGAVLVVMVFVVFYVYERRGPNADSHKFNEIQKLWASISQYPGMVEVDHYSNSAGRKASLGSKFRSDAKYEEVKRFYIAGLQQQGWMFQRERMLSNWGRNQGGRELEWTKDEYTFSVEFAGASGFEWDYAIGIDWYGK